MSGVRALHLITGLGTGGAELMLWRLLSRMRGEAAVVSMRETGPVGERIRELGVPVWSLGLRSGRPDPRGLVRLVRLLRRWRPEVLQTWMYHADLLGGVAARLVTGTPVVWNLRQSAVVESELRRGTLAAIRICAALSHRLPARIVSCSEAGRRFHAELGYAAERIVVIPNGFDLDRFRPDPAAATELRRELALPAEAILIGTIARFDPQKDHRNLFAAAARLVTARPEVRFVLCGDGIDWDNAKLRTWIEEAGLRHRVYLLGRRDDVWQVTAGLDILTSPSLQEGFPNVVGEAMACAVPCVVTDVGDSAELVGPTGIVVPPRDPVALADAWESLLRLGAAGRARMGRAARQRIEQSYSLRAVARRYEELYEHVRTGERGGKRTAPLSVRIGGEGASR